MEEFALVESWSKLYYIPTLSEFHIMLLGVIQQLRRQFFLPFNGVLKYPLELKKKIQSEQKKKSVSLY